MLQPTSNGAGMDLIYTVSIWLLPLLIAITFHEFEGGECLFSSFGS
jgi:hypothetical protein